MIDTIFHFTTVIFMFIALYYFYIQNKINERNHRSIDVLQRAIIQLQEESIMKILHKEFPSKKVEPKKKHKKKAGRPRKYSLAEARERKRQYDRAYNKKRKEHK